MLDKLFKGMGLSVKIENEDGMKAANGGNFTFKLVDENPSKTSAKDDQLGIKTITVDAFDEALKRVVDAHLRKAEFSRDMSDLFACMHAEIVGAKLKTALFTDGETVRINAISFARKLIETTSHCTFNVLRGEFEADSRMVQSALNACCLAVIALNDLVPILFDNSSEGGSTND